MGSRTDRGKPHRRVNEIAGTDMSPADEDRSWEPAFLEAMRQWPNVRKACLAASVGRRTAYDHRERHEDFRRAWDEAVDDGRDEIRSNIQDASKASDRILELCARLWLPEYKDNSTVSFNVDLGKLTDEQLDRIASGENPIRVCSGS